MTIANSKCLALSRSDLGRGRQRAISSGTSCARKAEMDSTTWRLALTQPSVASRSSARAMSACPYRFSRETSQGDPQIQPRCPSYPADGTSDQVCFATTNRRSRGGSFAGCLRERHSTPIIEECGFSIARQLPQSAPFDSTRQPHSVLLADDPSTKVQVQIIPKRASRRPDPQQPT